jgi:hypothetical protein
MERHLGRRRRKGVRAARRAVQRGPPWQRIGEPQRPSLTARQRWLTVGGVMMERSTDAAADGDLADFLERTLSAGPGPSPCALVTAAEAEGLARLADVFAHEHRGQRCGTLAAELADRLYARLAGLGL